MKDERRKLFEFILKNSKNPDAYKNIPDNYLIIPEFDVFPSQCNGEGFAQPIIEDATKPILIELYYMEILTAARVALKGTFSTMENMRNAVDIFFDPDYRNKKSGIKKLKTIQELAIIYYSNILMELSKGLEILKKKNPTEAETARVFIAGMHAGSSLAKWIAGSPDSLLCMAEKVINSGRNGGQKAQSHASLQTKALHERITSAAKSLLSEGRSHRDLAGILSTRFSYTSKHIRTILKEANLMGG